MSTRLMVTVVASLLTGCGTSTVCSGSVSSVSIAPRGGNVLFAGLGECVEGPGTTRTMTVVFKRATSLQLVVDGDLSTGSHVCGADFSVELDNLDGFPKSLAGGTASADTSCAVTRSGTGGTFSGVLQPTSGTTLLDVAFTWQSP